MCGIAGWVDFERDLTAERDTIAAMTATMACRGPDAGGLWCAPHSVIGHRRLAVIDIEGGIQPMLAARGPGVVLTFQRRDLQLPRAAPGAGRLRARLQDQVGHRGSAARLAAVGSPLRIPAERHVRLRGLGRGQPGTGSLRRAAGLCWSSMCRNWHAAPACRHPRGSIAAASSYVSEYAVKRPGNPGEIKRAHEQARVLALPAGPGPHEPVELPLGALPLLGGLLLEDAE